MTCKHILLIRFLIEPKIFFFLHTVKYFQVLLSNTNSIYDKSFVCRKLNDFM